MTEKKQNKGAVKIYDEVTNFIHYCISTQEEAENCHKWTDKKCKAFLKKHSPYKITVKR